MVKQTNIFWAPLIEYYACLWEIIFICFCSFFGSGFYPLGVHPFPSVYNELNLGILFVLPASSISVYSIMVSGWVSNSKYSIDVVIQAAAQMISYEVAIGLIILCVCIPANSFNLSYIIAG